MAAGSPCRDLADSPNRVLYFVKTDEEGVRRTSRRSATGKKRIHQWQEIVQQCREA
ncbi:MAG: hypothetical protein U1E38_09745 [Rhodospirillales bacterium]